jgi:hypothetical protein
MRYGLRTSVATSQGNNWNIDVIPEIDLRNGKEKAAKNCSCRWTSGQASQVFSRGFSIPVFLVEYGAILHDRLASTIRRDGSSRHAHYAEKVSNF